MASERVQRRLERLLDQIDEAEANGNWESVRDMALDVLEIDAENAEANAYLRAAERRVAGRSTAAPRGETQRLPLPNTKTFAALLLR